MTALLPPVVHPPRCDLPVLLSVPHAGRDYPRWLVDMAARGEPALAALEDPHVDRLIWRALGRGVGAVIARAPRAAVDCNRGEDEVDPAIIEGAHHGRVSTRARGGLGIVPGRTQQHGHLWRRTITRQQLHDRLDQAHRPYHQSIEEQLDRLVERFGCALLIDCHSMPPPPAGTPPVVFGDRNGSSADPWVIREAAAVSERNRLRAALNDPFAGGYVVERHGHPQRNVHAIQVEIDRRLYLDERLTSPGPGFDRAAVLMEQVAIELAESLLGRQFATAAE